MAYRSHKPFNRRVKLVKSAAVLERQRLSWEILVKEGVLSLKDLSDKLAERGSVNPQTLTAWSENLLSEDLRVVFDEVATEVLAGARSFQHLIIGRLENMYEQARELATFEVIKAREREAYTTGVDKSFDQLRAILAQEARVTGALGIVDAPKDVEDAIEQMVPIFTQLLKQAGVDMDGMDAIRMKQIIEDNLGEPN